jgi:hypothetical protein
MSIDNRRYYRLPPSEDAEPKTRFLLSGAEIPFTVVNMSPGGLLGYVSASDTRIEKDVFIPKIQIQLPHKPVVTYSGRVLRAETQPYGDSRFCAIEFVSYYRKRKVRSSKQPVQMAEDADMDRYFIHRLESIRFLDGTRTVKEEIHIQEMLYHAFDDIARRIPLEERWFFYEVLDAMKRHEPDYPEGLKREFLKFCRGSDRSQFRSEGGSIPRIFRWLRHLLGLWLL